MMQQRASHRRKFHLIYKTTCLVTNKYYFGMHSTDDLSDGYIGSGKILQYSVKKYGKENHHCEIFEMLPDRESLALREAEIVCKDKLIDPDCMNLCGGGDGVSIHSDETKAIIRQKRALQIMKPHSNKTKEKMSRARLNGLASGRIINVNGMKGKFHTDVTRKKLSDAHTGKKLTEEHKTNIVKAQLGLKRSEKTKQKMRDAAKNRKKVPPMSVETRLKISENSKRIWAEKRAINAKKTADAV